MKKIKLRQSLPEKQYKPYWIDERMLVVLLKAGGNQYPSTEQLARLGEMRSIGETGLFVLGMEKPGKKIVAKEPPDNVMLFLTAALFSKVMEGGPKNGVDKDASDKMLVLACFTSAKRWPRLRGMCGELSKRVVHGNPSMVRALADEQRRAGAALMFSGAMCGSAIRLALKFKELLSEVSPIEQLNFLLNESNDDEETRKSLAIARACVLLEDEAFLAAGGLNKVMTIFKDDPKMVRRFIEAYLPMPV